MDVIRKVISLCSQSVKRKIAISIGAALFTILISVSTNVLFGQLTAAVVELSKNEESLRRVVTITAIIATLYAINTVLSYFQERLGRTFRLLALNELRLMGYKKLQKLPMSFFHNTRPGSVFQRIAYVANVVNWIGDFIDFRINTVALPVLSLIPIFAFNWVIGAVTSFGVVVMILLQIRKARVRKPHMTAGNDAWDESIGIWTEHISHATTSRTSVNQTKIFDIFNKALNVQMGHRFRQFRVELNYNTLQSIVEAIVIISVISLSIYFSYLGTLGIAALVSIIVLIRNIVFNSRGIAQVYDSLMTASVEGQKYLNILDEDEDNIDMHATKNLATITSMSFKDVSFAYDKDAKKVLSGISFDIANKSTVAIVGVSGGGKSSIAALLTRMYRPTSGIIEINGEPADNYLRDSIIENMGVVMQDVALYHATIADNILLANPEASEEDVIKALKVANAWDFVQELSKGVHTLVGERGVKLSGGQRQRIAIARAAVKKPSLVVLDEATSALDSESEKAVQAGLKKLLKNRTAVIIAHRLSTIAHADQIIVLDKGKIVETGTYSDLKKANGPFASLLKHQEL